MLFSFLNRFFPRKKSPPSSTPSDYRLFNELCSECNGEFFPDFKLYVYDTTTPIDLLLFMPHRGLYYGEKISWHFEEIKDASVQRAAKGDKKSSSTRFSTIENAIRQKLSSVLSFDSTPCERFVWLEHIREDEFDLLDSSFHELLPKSRLIFADDTAASARGKLENLADFQSEPFSVVKIIGSLNAHKILLPENGALFGSFLSDEQNLFLDTEYSDTVTTLFGSSGGGKSTLLLRKALMLLLERPGSKALFVTPTILGGELLRNKMVSLMDYGAFTISMDSLIFTTPQASTPLEKIKAYEDVIAIFCDDSYRMEESYISMLKERREGRWLVLSTALEPDTLDNTFFLLNRYRERKQTLTIQVKAQEHILFTLITEIRKLLCYADKHDIMIVFPDADMILPIKKALDEYFDFNCRILDSFFSLQYQNIDSVLLATSECISGLRIPYLFLIHRVGTDDYAFELSRASDTATIITVPNHAGDNDGKDNQE